MFKLLTLGALVVGAGLRAAEAKPLQLALFNPVQVRPATDSIEGARLNVIYGKNVGLTGVDVGLVNHLTGSCTGLQNGPVNITEGSFTGIQDGWLYSRTNGSITGIQSGAITINGAITGLQAGFVNLAGAVDGIQFGVFNQCAGLSGLQIGLLNQDLSNQKWPLLPLVRWAF
jgi:hypothetical protein